jgi:hypothetical protein
MKPTICEVYKMGADNFSDQVNAVRAALNLSEEELVQPDQESDGPGGTQRGTEFSGEIIGISNIKEDGTKADTVGGRKFRGTQARLWGFSEKRGVAAIGTGRSAPKDDFQHVFFMKEEKIWCSVMEDGAHI